MADTDAFFTPEPTTDYTLVPASDALRAGGEAGTLTFPSGYTTPHPENNIVYARYFPANPIRKPRNGKSPCAARWWCWRSGTPTPRVTSGCASCSSKLGIASLRISLPYHDRRMPAELTRADYIVVANIGPHAAGVPPGGAGRAPRAVVAARPGLRAARPARHQSRIVPGDADRRARAAGPGAGAQPRLAALRRRGLARALHRARAAGDRRPRRSRGRCATCGGRSARGVT